MGQGTESCGGYELDYDEYDFDSSEGYNVWTSKDGSSHAVESMSNPHIENTIRHCEMLSRTSTFSCDSDKWDDWINVFESVLEDRRRKGIFISRKDAGETVETYKRKKRKASASTKKYLRELSEGCKRVEMKCHCGSKYEAKVADLKRGWAQSCSKRCASIKREYGRPNAKFIKEL
tara:strand:+ start:21991 stop:22518 length:528 start_codon:yes stop_codon:yes gene_type:complete